MTAALPVSVHAAVLREEDMLCDMDLALDQLCRRNLSKNLWQCEMTMLPSTDLIKVLESTINEFGEMELPSGPYEGPDLSVVSKVCLKSVCAMEAPYFLQVLDEHGRNAVRTTASMVLLSLRFMALSKREYGPLPAGLTGRSLGFAALAVGVLGPLYSGRHLN